MNQQLFLNTPKHAYNKPQIEYIRQKNKQENSFLKFGPFL